MDKYKLYTDGKESGCLTVTAEGTTTVISATCYKKGGIIKISVFGAGEEYYLGTLMPENGVMTIKKRLSRFEASRLPKKIEYAADKRLKAEVEGLLWCQTSDGKLYGFDGSQSYVALPVRNNAGHCGRIRKCINGRQYLIFPGKRN